MHLHEIIAEQVGRRRGIFDPNGRGGSLSEENNFP